MDQQQAQDVTSDATATRNDEKLVLLPARVLKKRLEMFLQIFAAVTSPKQLYCHQLLYNYYLEIMPKADITTVKLAFECILTYKPASVMPYKDNIKRLFDDKTIRDELLTFNASTVADEDDQYTLDMTEYNNNSGSNNNNSSSGSCMIKIKEEHRAELIPMLVRIVYGRFTSKARGNKAAREQNLARFLLSNKFALI